MVYGKLLAGVPKHFYVTFSGWIYRILMAVVQILSIPIILRCLGIDDYAVFAVITGLIVWFNLSDLGLGYSVQNYISNLRIQGKSVRDFLSTITLFIFIVGFAEIIVFCLCSPFLQHFLLKHLKNDANHYLLALVGSVYILNAVFSISYRIFFAEQKGYWSYCYQSGGLIVALVAVFVLSFAHINAKLFWILIAWVFPQMLFSLASFIHVMPFRGALFKADRKIFREIFAKAWLFSMNAVGAAFVLGVDYIIMSQLLNAQDITVYNIFNKIFLFVYWGYNTVLVALWPVMAEQFASKDKRKIYETNMMLLRNIFWAFGYILLATLLIFFAKNFLMSFFAKGTLVVSSSVIVLFGVYYAVRFWVDSYTTAIQSRNKIKFIAFTVPIQAVVSIAFLYYFGAKYGLPGVLLALILCFLLTAAWVLPWYHYYSLAKDRVAND